MPNDKLLKLSWYCGAVPLAVGVTVFVLWLLTHWAALMFVGLFVIYAGMTIVLIGLGCLGAFLLRHWRLTKSWANVLIPSLKSASLLLVNFPVAAAIVLIVIHFETTFFVTVTNSSSEVVDSFKLTAPGVNVELGPLQAGRKKKTSFQIEGDGVLRFTALQSGRNIEGTVEDYVTNGLGGNKVVELNSGGNFRVFEKKKGI